MNKIRITGGMAYDPLTHTSEIKNIDIIGGRITDDPDFVADTTIDASGCYVTPGLIDFHLHCYNLGSDGGSDADTFCLPNGVTTCIDAGTCGSANYKEFHTGVVCRSATRVLALLHVAAEGQTTGKHPENQTPSAWDTDAIASLVQRYPEIVGLKVRMGHNVLDIYGLHDEPLTEGIALAQRLGKRVVVHVNNPNVPIECIAQSLRPGDVFCHMYAGSDESIVDDSGHVKPGIRNARERGVIFDACNGRGNFLFEVAEPAIDDGFLPDIVSSDNSPVSNYRQPLISLPRLLSKYMMFGMSLEDVIDSATIRPARWLGMESLATLSPGSEADIAIWRLEKKKVLHKDWKGVTREGDVVLIPQLTIRDGSIVYSQSDFL